MKIQKLKQAYFGDVAARYDANRAGAKWRAEQEAVREFLGRIRETLGDYSLVDIPVGTGRFLEFYREFDVAATGLDVSGDMLAEAGFELERCIYVNFAGVFGWFWHSRVLGRDVVSPQSAQFVDRLVPYLSAVERLVRPVVGQSLFAVLRKP